MSFTDQEIAYERALERRRKTRHRCECGDDLPGFCPGPDACPMVARDGDGEQETD